MTSAPLPHKLRSERMHLRDNYEVNFLTWMQDTDVALLLLDLPPGSNKASETGQKLAGGHFTGKLKVFEHQEAIKERPGSPQELTVLEVYRRQKTVSLSTACNFRRQKAKWNSFKFPEISLPEQGPRTKSPHQQVATLCWGGYPTWDQPSHQAKQRAEHRRCSARSCAPSCPDTAPPPPVHMQNFPI